MTNWELSGDRARSVRQALAADGVPTSRFQGVVACADTKLKYPNKPLNPKNRRVTLLLPWEMPSDIDRTKEANRAIRTNLAPPPVEKVPAVKPDLHNED